MTQFFVAVQTRKRMVEHSNLKQAKSGPQNIQTGLTGFFRTKIERIVMLINNPVNPVNPVYCLRDLTLGNNRSLIANRSTAAN